MIAQKPYLIRALYEWIIDSGCAPHVLIDVSVVGVEVPQEYVENGEIVLDLSPAAISHLNITNQRIEFEASFGGIPRFIIAPMKSILAIYAGDNGRGMVFSPDDDDTGGGGDEGGPKKKILPVKEEKPQKGKPSHLKLVK